MGILPRLSSPHSFLPSPRCPTHTAVIKGSCAAAGAFSQTQDIVAVCSWLSCQVSIIQSKASLFPDSNVRHLASQTTFTEVRTVVKDSAHLLCSNYRPVFEDYCEIRTLSKQHHVCHHVRAACYREPFSPWKQHLSVLPQFVRKRRRWSPRIPSSIPGYDPYHRGASCSTELLLHMWSFVERRTRIPRLQRVRWLFPSTTMPTL